jgi:tRNA uridine 5-carbamoylmethylation protein Kti12
MLLTICGGIITGLIVYWLTNIRQSSLSKIEKEYLILLKVRNLCCKNIREINHIIEKNTYFSNFDSSFYAMFDKMEEVQSILYDIMSKELFLKCKLEENNPLNYDITNALFDKYQQAGDIEVEMQPLLTKLREIQKETSEKITPILGKYKQTLDICKKSGL